jgi:hypothetical protein
MVTVGKVKTGMQVEIELVDQAGSAENLKLIIVPTKQADYAHGLLGEDTPLARSLMGKAAGEEVTYLLDDIVKVRILVVNSIGATLTSEAAAQREAEYHKAIADLDKRNAVAFAASFSGKWGDYDPGAVEDWDNEPKSEDKS